MYTQPHRNKRGAVLLVSKSVHLWCNKAFEYLPAELTISLMYLRHTLMKLESHIIATHSFLYLFRFV